VLGVVALVWLTWTVQPLFGDDFSHLKRTVCNQSGSDEVLLLIVVLLTILVILPSAIVTLGMTITVLIRWRGPLVLAACGLSALILFTETVLGFAHVLRLIDLTKRCPS
jgi:hypothetical protein